MNTYSNKLSESNSPYLLQHANNPVNWQPYEPELIGISNSNKLLIISIGYSACHWCHVMEHESFEDEEVAKVMNENFINIKVDREEHPHVDKVYMQACRLMTGGGGWPLNVVCTPDGVPIHAGTYFPKDNWINLLTNVSKLWNENPNQVEEFKIKLSEVLKTDNSNQIIEVSNSNIIEALNKNTQLLDYNNGGLQGSAKFPMPVLLNNIFNWSVVFGDTNLEQFVNLTLLKMIKGGMWDLVEGGFARYSVDDRWFVPHFEKMLYDNAQLLPLYIYAGQRINLPLLSQVGESIIEFCNSDLLQSNGLYAAALDADTSEGEGVYYSLRREEYHSILNNEELKFCERYMGFSEKGNWEKGLNIPIIEEPPQIIMNETGMTAEELESLQRGIFMKFRNLRENKEKPGLDYKCLCSWNGLMLSGLANSARLNLKYLKTAENLVEAMKQFHTGKGLFHQISMGKTKLTGYLDDYAFYIKGLLDLFQSSQNDNYAHAALELTERCLENHLSEDGKLQFQNIDQVLFTPVPDWEDNVVPSAIGTMVSNLQVVSNIFGKTASPGPI